jgi:hypothetical protein
MKTETTDKPNTPTSGLSIRALFGWVGAWKQRRQNARCAAGYHSPLEFYRDGSDPDVFYQFTGCKYCAWEKYEGVMICWHNRVNPQPRRGSIEAYNAKITANATGHATADNNQPT